MDFNVGLLLFLFLFFVLPLIQRVLGRAKQAPPGSQPGQRRPGVPPGRQEGRARLPEGSRTGTPDRSEADEPVRAEPERAADLIPDDLWEILTGERRAPAPSPHRPAPEPELETDTGWGSGAEEAWQPEEAAAQIPDEEQRYQEPDPLEAPWHREHEEPITASESPLPPATARPSPYATAEPPRPRPYSLEARRRRTPPSLSSRSDLKRAFVLREVLGPPKALE